MKNNRFIMLCSLCLISSSLFFFGCSGTSSTPTTTSTVATTTTSTTTSTTSTSTASTSTITTTSTTLETSTTTSSTTTTTILVSNGLTAYYRFDETTGSIASDSSENNLNGTVYGGASWVSGKINNCLSFDGSNDCVKIPATAEAAPTQISSLATGSIALWFKFNGTPPFLLPLLYQGSSPESSPTGVGSKEGIIIEVGHAGIRDDSDNLFFTTTLAGTNQPIHCFDSRSSLTAETWYHFVAVVSTEGNTGYLNGVEITDRRYNFGTASDSYFFNAVSGGILSIGYGRFAFITPGQFYYFNGLIDEVRIYNRAITSTEVMQLYEQGL